ncbi:TerD family protein [Dactylosporangium sp. NPDC000521]|uniref:TerD family protein n=1 Tax=Dactylosporangium sp. NPDC000521 TaxID=3363975 RepID=UPI00367D90D3
MAQVFTRGQKSPLSALTSTDELYVGVFLDGPGLTWDISCFGLDAANRMADDAYFIFFNQPSSPEGSIQKVGAQGGDTEGFRAVLSRVPEKIAKLSFCASIDGAGTARQLRSGYIRIVAGGQEVVRYSFTGADFGTERAIIIGDVYRKGVWRVGAVGQGFAGGLADLIRSYGGTVDDEPAPAPAAPPPSFAPPPPAAQAPPPPPAQAPPPAPAQALPPPPVQAPRGFAPPPHMPGPPVPAPAQQQQQWGPPPVQHPRQPHGAPVPPQPERVRPGVMTSLDKYREAPTTGRWTKQGSKMVKVALGPEVHARRGSMVAYQGSVEFIYKGSGGLRAMFEGAVTGQGLKLMTCKGQGEVFLAENATDLHIVELDGQSLCVNADNVLAFDATLQTQIARIESPGIPGGGMFHLVVSGQGAIVVMTRGTPVTLQCQGPTFADMKAVVAWTSGMRVSVSTQVRLSRQLYAGDSGEGLALQFMGLQGHFVVVQPYEV